MAQKLFSRKIGEISRYRCQEQETTQLLTEGCKTIAAKECKKTHYTRAETPSKAGKETQFLTEGCQIIAAKEYKEAYDRRAETASIARKETKTHPGATPLLQIKPRAYSGKQ